MFTETDLENDFGPRRKAGFLRELYRFQEEHGLCQDTAESSRRTSMIPIGIYDGGPPPEDIPFRTAEETH